MSLDTIKALGQVSRDLDNAVTALETLEKQAVRAETAFKVGQAKAYLSAEGSIQAREAQATVETEQLRDAHEGAAAAVRVQREHIKSLHARLDVGRSLLAAERHLAGVAS